MPHKRTRAILTIKEATFFTNTNNKSMLAEMKNRLRAQTLNVFSLAGTHSHINSVTIGFEGMQPVTFQLAEDDHNTIHHKLAVLNLDDMKQRIGENLELAINQITGSSNSERTDQLAPLVNPLLSPGQPAHIPQMESARRIVGLTTSNVPRPPWYAWYRDWTLQRNQRTTNARQVTTPPNDESEPFKNIRRILLTSTKEDIKLELQPADGATISQIEQWISNISAIEELDTLTSLITREHNNPLKETKPRSLGHAATFLHTNGLWAEFTTATEQKLIILLRDRVLELSKSQTFQTELASSSPVL